MVEDGLHDQVGPYDRKDCMNDNIGLELWILTYLNSGMWSKLPGFIMIHIVRFGSLDVLFGQILVL